jgi:hypothetical protein
MTRNILLIAYVLAVVSSMGAAQARPYPGAELAQTYERFLADINKIPAFENYLGVAP